MECGTLIWFTYQFRKTVSFSYENSRKLKRSNVQDLSCLDLKGWTRILSQKVDSMKEINNIKDVKKISLHNNNDKKLFPPINVELSIRGSF